MSDETRIADVRPGEAGTADLPDLALGPVLIVAGLVGAALVAFSDRYGYHRDELYFLQSGRHLAWGYPDQPPLVPLIARLISDLAPGSLVLLRLPSAVAAAALVVLTAMITRELGGRRTAQILAAGIIALSPVVLGSSHLLSTTTFDLPFWALLCLLFLRILRTGNDRLWLLAGLVAGVGLLDTDLVAFLIFAVVAGLVAVGPRHPLRSPWFYAGGAIALGLWAPYLAWQAAYGWPELKVAHSIAAGGSGSSAPWWQLLPEQFGLVTPIFAPVWIAGLVRLFRELRWCRAVGVAYPVLAVAFMLTGGKPYYLAGMFPALIGAGAQPAADWLARAVRRRGLVVAAVALSLASVPITLPVLPASSLHSTPIVAIVLASNYGEAGAVDRFGPADGLPAAYSGDNSFWYWGPPRASATTAVVVGYGRSQLGFCGTVRLALALNNRENLNDDEQGAPVWICQQLRESWQAIWPSQRYFG